MSTLRFFSITRAVPLLLALFVSQASHAEGRLIGGNPKDNAVVSDFNGTVTLWFTGNIGERSPSLVILDKNGKRVDNGNARLHLNKDSRSELSTSITAPDAGSYIAHYRVVTEDGLVISGLYRFAIKTP